MVFTSAGASNKSTWRRSKTPGWASVCLKQRVEESSELEVDNEPHRLTSRANTHQNLGQNNNLPVRSFSSVLLPAVTFPPLIDHGDHKKLVVSNSGTTQTQSSKFNDETNIIEAYDKLKELHCWADESLIADIMGIVDNDVRKASDLLREMVSSESFENKDGNTGQGDFVRESTELANLGCIPQDCPNNKNGVANNNYDFCENEISDDAAAHIYQLLGNLPSIPIEPEWEEDDIYLTHRRDALRMMRLASQHSRLAADAYSRGNHSSAKHYSVKARQQWMAAEKLNVNAAKEILNIRNSKNGLWKLDLHGLHAVEAVQALQERLQKLESLGQRDRLASPNRSTTGVGSTFHAFSASCSMEINELGEQCSSDRQGPTLLHVITGVGNHSRGQAVLPSVIRSYLSENGYHYEESRPGVIAVRPKFRN